MAKLSTCPICGYTDTADDADALQSAIEEHIRLSHNLDPATLGGAGSDVKNVSDAEAARAGGQGYVDVPGTPIIPVAANAGGTAGAPTAANAVYAGGVIANNNDNGPRPTDNEHRNDDAQ